MAINTLQQLQTRSLRVLATKPHINPYGTSIERQVRMASLATFKVPQVENENNVGSMGYLNTK